MTLTTQVTGQKRRPRAEIRQLVAEFRSSGLTEAEFCHSRGLSRSTLYRHLRQQRSQAHVISAKTQLVPVELAAAPRREVNNNGSGLAVVLASGRKIEVAQAFDAFTLERLVSVLERV
jgi:lambda repressor-like predicted transcriptional regulator